MNRQFSFEYTHVDSLDRLSEADRELVEAARKACESSYAPYSHFRVGAAARLESGLTVTGSNQESEVFPSGLCAERTLLYHYQAHYADDPIVSFAIASVPSERECYPCGGCRQVLRDVEKRQQKPFRVIMSSTDSATVVESASDLLPFVFEL